MISQDYRCPSCNQSLETGFLYVRGIGASLHWSTRSDTGFLARRNLEQIDLSQVSVTGTGGQAVVKAWLCSACNFVCFRRA